MAPVVANVLVAEERETGFDTLSPDRILKSYRLPIPIVRGRVRVDTCCQAHYKPLIRLFSQGTFVARRIPSCLGSIRRRIVGRLSKFDQVERTFEAFDRVSCGKHQASFPILEQARGQFRRWFKSIRPDIYDVSRTIDSDRIVQPLCPYSPRMKYAQASCRRFNRLKP
jgi:hypothetical protein